MRSDVRARGGVKLQLAIDLQHAATCFGTPDLRDRWTLATGMPALPCVGMISICQPRRFASDRLPVVSGFRQSRYPPAGRGRLHCSNLTLQSANPAAAVRYAAAASKPAKSVSPGCRPIGLNSAPRWRLSQKISEAIRSTRGADHRREHQRVSQLVDRVMTLYRRHAPGQRQTLALHRQVRIDDLHPVSGRRSPDCFCRNEGLATRIGCARLCCR